MLDFSKAKGLAFRAREALGITWLEAASKELRRASPTLEEEALLNWLIRKPVIRSYQRSSFPQPAGCYPIDNRVKFTQGHTRRQEEDRGIWALCPLC